MITTLLALTAILAGRIEDEPLPDGNKLVAVSAILERPSIAPGGTVALLVRLKIEPEWHVYWQNPGDSGMPTRFELALPPGVEAGPPRFPWPEHHEDPGDIKSFVHTGTLDVLFDLRASEKAAPAAPAPLAIEASWLVCKEICVRGSGRAALELAIAPGKVGPGDTVPGDTVPQHAAEFAAARARLPRPWSELANARVTWSGAPESPQLSLVVPGASALELFPTSQLPLELAERTVRAGKDGASLKASFSFEAKEEGALPRLAALVWVRQGEKEAAYLLESEFPAPAKR